MNKSSQPPIGQAPRAAIVARLQRLFLRFLGVLALLAWLFLVASQFFLNQSNGIQ